MSSPSVQSLRKGLRLLELLLDGSHGIASAAEACDMPISTAHRMLATLRASGFLIQPNRGSYLPGPMLTDLGSALRYREVIARVARPVLDRLARRTGLTAHLGVFDTDMVTYLVKASGRVPMLTRENMQLEAYCSGIGKVLLANLSHEDAGAYLATGPFVQLTEATIVDPSALALALEEVRRSGVGFDEGEFQQGLSCVAVPVLSPRGQVCAAISLSSSDGCATMPVEARIGNLKASAASIAACLSGQRAS
ncbi:IclR family transcriptional regulator [soil metagenome]